MANYSTKHFDDILKIINETKIEPINPMLGLREVAIYKPLSMSEIIRKAIENWEQIDIEIQKEILNRNNIVEPNINLIVDLYTEKIKNQK